MNVETGDRHGGGVKLLRDMVLVGGLEDPRTRKTGVVEDKSSTDELSWSAQWPFGLLQNVLPTRATEY